MKEHAILYKYEFLHIQSNEFQQFQVINRFKVKGMLCYLKGFPRYKGSLVLQTMFLKYLILDMTLETLAVDSLEKCKV